MMSITFSFFYYKVFENKIHYDTSFNKNLFKLQLSFIKEYLHEKVKTK